MRPNVESHDRVNYQILTEIIRTAGWVTESDIPAERLHKGAKKQNEQVTVNYTLPATDARLLLTTPDVARKQLCRVGLENPLDSTLGFLNTDSAFVEKLSDVHQAVGYRHQNTYLEPVADPNHIFRGQIPANFDWITLHDTIWSCVHAGREIERCHASIHKILNTYNK